MNIVPYLSSMPKLLLLCLISCLIIFSCSSSLSENSSAAKTGKIVKIKTKMVQLLDLQTSTKEAQ